MFGYYAFGAPYFADSPIIVVIPIPPVVPPGTVVQTLVVPCRTRTCSTRSDFSLYQLQETFEDAPEPVITQTFTRPRTDFDLHTLEDSDIVPMTILVECKTRTCNSQNDLTIYNLQDALFFNGVPLSFVVDCPPGYACPSGIFPHTFTYPPGTFNFPIPPIVPGQPILLSMTGCSSNVNIVLPAGSSQTAINNAAQQVIQQVAAQQAQCDAIKLAGPLLPLAITLSDIPAYACANAPLALAIFGSSSPARTPITFAVSSQPSFLVATQSSTTLFLDGTPAPIGVYNFTVTATAPGSPSASGTKSYTLNVVGIATASPLPNGSTGVAYSETLTAPSIPGTLTWSVTSGVLPDGLSLNSSTGEISGTPATDIIDTFTIGVTNGTVSCSKEFDLEIVETPAWPNFLFTDLFANNGALSLATINGYNKLIGDPANGTGLGASITLIWTVTGAPASYTLSFEGDSVATLADAGNWRVTINNLNIVAATLSFPLGVYVKVNGATIYFYEIDSTTGPLFVDTPIMAGDTLTVAFGIDGNFALAGSHQITVTTSQLP